MSLNVVRVARRRTTSSRRDDNIRAKNTPWCGRVDCASRRVATSCFLLALLLSFQGGVESTCLRRVLQSGPTVADVRAEVVNLRDALQKVHQYNVAAAMVQTLLQPSPPIPLLDLLNTTFLLPKTTTFTASGFNRGQGSALTSLLPNHVIQGRFEFSKQVCGEPLPIVFQPEGWTVNTLQLGSVLQRYAPAENAVYLGPSGVEEPRAQIVHPSLYSGRYFTAQGINAVLLQSPV